MDWLARHKTQINYERKLLEIELPDGQKAEIKGDAPRKLTRFLTTAKAEKCL